MLIPVEIKHLSNFFRFHELRLFCLLTQKRLIKSVRKGGQGGFHFAEFQLAGILSTNKPFPCLRKTEAMLKKLMIQYKKFAQKVLSLFVWTNQSQLKLTKNVHSAFIIYASSRSCSGESPFSTCANC